MSYIIFAGLLNATCETERMPLDASQKLSNHEHEELESDPTKLMAPIRTEYRTKKTWRSLKNRTITRNLITSDRAHDLLYPNK